VDNGDPYQKQLKAQVDELKKMLPQFKSIQLAYQSRFGNSPWLQPYLDDTLKQFKDEQVVIYPISFMIDNSETDLELKIEYAEMAKELGIQNFEVVSCPNDDDNTVDFLADLIRQYND
jgi:ferrochelatase